MAADEPSAGGIAESARRLGQSALGLIRTRVELFAIELQEEKLRALGHVMWLAVALALGIAAILLAIGVLALFLWQKTGYTGLIALAVVVLGAAVAAFAWLRRKILSGPEPFASTVEEFRKDMTWLRRDE